MQLIVNIFSSSILPHDTTEVDGLQTLQRRTSLKIPGVLAVGEVQGSQYLLLEWLEKTQPKGDFWEPFAEGLAQIHDTTNPLFGWTHANYIGSLHQQNDYKKTWAEFYATQRLMPLVENLFYNALLEKSDVKAAEGLCIRLNQIFPEELPSLLHGDLWSGNFCAVSSFEDNKDVVRPAIYDPAVYFGHREMDVGMSLLFGGFNSRFYDAYQAVFPLEEGWKKRVPLTQLYPLLVHAILFKGGYVQQCKKILEAFS